MRSNNINYQPELDHVRAYAAMLVVIYHGFHMISYQLLHGTGYAPDDWPRTTNPLSALLIEGHIAVGLFIVLSGFIFTVGAWQADIVYGKFIKNRLLRTYPLFLVLLFVGMHSFPDNFSFSGLAQTLFGLANLPTSLKGGTFTSMFWTIAIEWQFYLAFPFLLAIANRKGSRALMMMIALILMLRVLAWQSGGNERDLSYWTIVGRMDQFLIGMLAGIYYRTRFNIHRAMPWRFLLSLVVITLLVYAYHLKGGWPKSHPFKLVWPTVEAGMWAFFLITYLSLAQRMPALISRALAAIGTISYSIYLLHMTVIGICIRHQWYFEPDGMSAYGIALLTITIIVLPTTLLVATLSYHAVEKPFLDMRTSYKAGPAHKPYAVPKSGRATTAN